MSGFIDTGSGALGSLMPDASTLRALGLTTDSGNIDLPSLLSMAMQGAASLRSPRPLVMRAPAAFHPYASGNFIGAGFQPSRFTIRVPDDLALLAALGLRLR